MAISVGDIFVGLKLDTRGFEGGAPAVAKLGQQLDLFRTPAASAAAAVRSAGTEIVATSDAAARASGHFELSSRVMARFAAIGVQEVVPSLQGSRLALENVFQPVLRLVSGFGGLGIAAVGAAAVLGGIAWATFRSGAERSADGVRGLAEEITAMEKKLTDSLPSLERWGRLANRLRGDEGTGFELSGGPTAADIAGFARGRAGTVAGRVGGLRADIERARGNALLEDPNIGPGGSFARKQAEDAARAFFDLEKSVKEFTAAGSAAAVSDPLQKMLIEDWKQAQTLLAKIREITDPALRDELAGIVGAEGGKRQILIRDQALKAAGPGAAEGLGLGANNLFAGFKDIEGVQADVRNFTGEIERMARAGVPARDLFNEIGKAQAGLDLRIANLREKFADQPAVLDKIRDAFAGIQFGGLARSLDEAVRSIDNLKQGTATLIDTGEGIQRTWVPALERAGAATSQFSTAMAGAVPQVDFLRSSVVSVTGDVLALASAFAFAAQEALFLNAVVGSTANLGAAGSGGLVGAVGQGG